MSAADGKLLAGYESGHVTVWDWSNNTQLMTVDMSPHIGTLMSLTWDCGQCRGVLVGSEARLTVFDEQLTVTRSRDITNPGVSCVTLRIDKQLVVTGRDTSQRWIIFKIYESVVIFENLANQRLLC